MKFLDFNQIKNLNLSAEELFQWTCETWAKQDSFILPPKTHTWMGERGRFMTMPCVMPNEDIAGVKFISRNVDDANADPKRNSNIMLQRLSRHGLYAVIDGTWITTMRTGACAYYHATKFAKSTPKTLAVYGLGLTARSFMFFWYNLYKKPITIKLMPYKDQHELFMQKYPENEYIKYQLVDSIEDLFDADIIVSCVSFAHSVICENTNVFKKGCNVVPVHTAGFQNCDLVFDKVFVDDIGHVQGYKYFNEFKDKMTRITEVETAVKTGRDNDEQRIVVYNGGLAIFDMYWAMKVIEKFGDKCVDLPMSYPEERFWI